MISFNFEYKQYNYSIFGKERVWKLKWQNKADFRYNFVLEYRPQSPLLESNVDGEAKQPTEEETGEEPTSGMGIGIVIGIILIVILVLGSVAGVIW